MKRRDFMIVGGVAPLLVPAHVVQAQTGAAAATLSWSLASSFPPVLDTIYGGGERFAKTVETLSEGKFKITILPLGKPIAPFGVFDAVSKGEVELGHTAGYYYVAKDKALAFDTGVPFGLTARQQNAWVMEGGGMALLRALFAKYNIVNFPAGNTGTQMGGWFNKRIERADDFAGLKMRIAGLGGQIMKSLGADTVTLPGSEIVAAMKDKKIDAAEWVGPYDDEKLGLPKVAKYYYYPGWWEPSTTLSIYINKPKFDALSPHYKSIIEMAAAETNMWMMAAYDTRNADAYRRLVSTGQYIDSFPDAHLGRAFDKATELYKAESASNPEFKTLYGALLKFRLNVVRWHNTAEAAMQNTTATKLIR